MRKGSKLRNGQTRGKHREWRLMLLLQLLLLRPAIHRVLLLALLLALLL